MKPRLDIEPTLAAGNEDHHGQATKTIMAKKFDELSFLSHRLEFKAPRLAITLASSNELTSDPG